MNQIVQHEVTVNEAGAVGLNASFIGAPFKVLLTNGYEVTPDLTTGKTHVSIHDLPGLIAAIVRSRVLNPRKLSGEDLKFIRSSLAFKSSEVAKMLDVTPEHYSRCENGTRTLSPAQEKFYRMMVFLCMSATDVTVRKTLEERLKQEPNPEASKKAIGVFKKIFLEMKIDPVFDPEDGIEMVLGRYSSRDDCNGPCDDDGDWAEETDLAA